MHFLVWQLDTKVSACCFVSNRYVTFHCPLGGSFPESSPCKRFSIAQGGGIQITGSSTVLTITSTSIYQNTAGSVSHTPVSNQRAHHNAPLELPILVTTHPVDVTMSCASGRRDLHQWRHCCYRGIPDLLQQCYSGEIASFKLWVHHDALLT